MNESISQNILISSTGFEKEKTYWLNKLQGELVLSSFPCDFSSLGLNCHNPDMGVEEFTFTNDISERIYAFSKGSWHGIYMILLSGLSYLLYRYTGSGDITLISPIFKQERAGEYFNNLLLQRNRINPENTFKDLLLQIKNTMNEANGNMNYPFDKIMKALNLQPEGKDGWMPGSLIIFNGIHDLSCLDKRKYNNIICFDMTDKQLKCSISYNSSLYNAFTIKQIGSHLANYLEKVLQNPVIKLKDVEILSDEERQQILKDFNNTYAEYPKDKTINKLFEEQVQKTPNSIAVICEGRELTYSQLNDKAKRLAANLKGNGIKKGDMVGLMVPRSLEMIIGIIGILKAGAVCLPIDRKYPEERIRIILEDSQTKFLIKSGAANQLHGFGGVTIELNLDELDSCEPVVYFEEEAASESLAYVIYTSGSTGKPKGVMLNHYGINNHTFTKIKELKLKEDDILCHNLSINFVASIWQVFAPLFLGAKLLVYTEDIINNSYELLQRVEEDGVSVLEIVPTLLNSYLNVLEFGKRKLALDSLRLLVLTGEKIAAQLVNKFYSLYTISLVNAYGQSECSDDTLHYHIPYNVNTVSVPIGSPSNNTRVYILNDMQQLQPVGIQGELCISGDGLASGYLYRPELTDEKFISNPYEPGMLMYRTGDIARWFADGTVEYIGRYDHQVKIRGYRIELGEIESQLISYHSIKECVVIDKEGENEDKYLCAYFTSENNLMLKEIREYLSDKLPEYMIPSRFIQLKKIPLTPNGKVDRKSLPDEGHVGCVEIDYVAPGNVIEEKLVEVWKSVLGADRIGITDNFFNLGGDSIKAIQVSAHLQSSNLKLRMKDLFDYPIICELSKKVSFITTKSEQGIVTGDVDLLPIQRWFFEREFTDMHYYNQSFTLYRKDGFDEGLIRKAFTKIVEHHDALRMVFKVNGNKVEQYNRDTSGELFTLKVIDYSGDKAFRSKIEEEINRIQESFDLTNGPLIKLGLYKTDTGDHLQIITHYLVIDGLSWRILLEDFATTYSQAMGNQSIKLSEKTDSYKVWSDKLKSISNSREILQEIDYWENIENSNIALLPKDNPSGENKNKYQRYMTVVFTEEETENLLKKANNAYGTDVTDILLTALGLSFKEWSGESKILLEMQGHGREEIVKADISRTIGWFTSMYPIVIDMSRPDDISYVVKSVKDTLRRIPNKGIGYGILKYLTDEENKKSLKFRTKPEIVFNYVGQFNDDINLNVFSLSNLPAGGKHTSDNMERPHSFKINAAIADGKLQVLFLYNSCQYNSTTIQRICDKFKSNLIEIINHCTNKKYKELTPGDLTYKNLSIDELDNLKRYVAGAIGSEMVIQDAYTLTPTQERMLFYSLFYKESSVYFKQYVFDLNEDIDIELFNQSFKNLVQRHDILRTIFTYKRIKKPMQIVLKQRSADILYEDISGMDENSRNIYLEAFKNKDKEKGFNLLKDILVRIAVFKIDRRRCKVIFSFHHIIMDGWCMGIAAEETFSVYRSLKDGKPMQLDKIYPYKHYISWIQEQNYEEALSYWKSYLEGYTQNQPLCIGTNREKDRGYIHEVHSFKLDGELTHGLLDVAKSNQVTPNIIFQAVWGIMLQVMSSSDDVVFGVVISGRPAEVEGIERMLGVFVNVVPVRVSYEQNKNFHDLVIETRDAMISAEKFSYFPLLELQEKTNLKQIDHVIVYQNYLRSDEEKSINDIEYFEQTSYDLNVCITPSSEFMFDFSYNAFKLNRNVMKTIENNLVYLLKTIIDNPLIKLKELIDVTKNLSKS